MQTGGVSYVSGHGTAPGRRFFSKSLLDIVWALIF